MQKGLELSMLFAHPQMLQQSAVSAIYMFKFETKMEGEI